MNISNLTPQQLRNAADLKERIDALQNELDGLVRGEVSVPAQAIIEAPDRPKNGRRKKRKKVSAEGRANIAAAQRARWAARRMGKLNVKVAAEPEQPVEKPKKKRNISEAGRRAMSLAGKRRWAKVRMAAKSSR